MYNKIDIIVLDPARRGVDEKALNAIEQSDAEKIIYISCNPATLARDLKTLLKNGKYKIKLALPYDMFPQTSEVETMVELIKVL